VHLSIAIPEAQVVEAPVLLWLVGMAPACDVEADEQEGVVRLWLLCSGVDG
jgi:hypothetical protein